jgi:hypothetical protein
MFTPNEWDCARLRSSEPWRRGFAAPAKKVLLPDSRLSITDSKQPERQGQRREAGFLWIREAAIPLLKESPRSSAKLGFLKGFRAAFAQPVTNPFELLAGTESPIAASLPAAAISRMVQPAMGKLGAGVGSASPRTASGGRRDGISVHLFIFLCGSYCILDRSPLRCVN